MIGIKKFISALLTVAMSLSIAAVPVLAATYKYEIEAAALNELGLYKGINESYFDPDLGSNLDRQTGVVMLLRMFGQEDEAKSLTYEKANSILSKFKDSGKIADWSKKQVAYAVDKGYVKGYADDSTFRPLAALNGKAYCSLILQQLGYNGDFEYDRAAAKLSEVGGLTSSQANTFNSDTPITKDSLVGISYGALKAKYKSNGEKLVTALVNKGHVSKQKAKEVGLEILEIKSVDSIDDITVTIGKSPSLPSKVKVTYEDGTKGDESVTWDKVDTSSTGTKTITGKIADSNVTAKVKVIVVSDKQSATAVSSGNLREIIVKFNNPVKSESAAKNKANYDVKKNTVINVELSDDKKTATLLLENALKQQADVELTVKKAVGLDSDADLTVKNVKDVTVPSIDNVVAEGSSYLKVTFSEPVQNATSASNYTIDGKSIGASKVTLSKDEKTVSFKLIKGLSSGSHKLAVKSKILDYANYSVEDNEEKFSVEEDNKAPTAKVVEATQTKIVISFSEDVEEIRENDIDLSSNAKIESIKFEDNTTLTIFFKVENAFPASGGRITIEDVTDFSGNKTDIKLDVDPEYDLIRPKYVNYTIVSQKAIVLEFSEEVYEKYGKFELINDKKDEIDLASAYYYKDKDGNSVKTKLVLKRKDGSAFDYGKYKLSISDVTDLNPLKNEIEPLTVEIKVSDKTAPTVSNVYINKAENQLVVKFDEEVDKSSATNYSNYIYTYKNISKKLDKSTMDIELLSDNKTVRITFPSDLDDYDKDEIVLVSDISRIQVEAVKDINGNAMEAISFGSKEFIVDSNTAPTITSATVTGKNKIVVKLKGSIDKGTLQPDDFYITTAKDSKGNVAVIDAYEATYNSDTNLITLQVSADIDPNGTIDGKALYLALQKAKDVETSNIFGQKLVLASAIKIGDGFKPVARKIASSRYEKGVGTVIFVELSENLKLNEGEALSDTDLHQFRVKANGKTVTAKIYYYNAASKNDSSTEENEMYARFKIVIDGDYRNKKVQVLFYADVTPTIKDASGNVLVDFDLSDTVD